MKFNYFLFSVLFFLSSVSIAQDSPGGVSTPVNNIFWLKSNNGVTFDGSHDVTTWADQFNSNNATNNTTATNPSYDVAAGIGSNNEPAILFSSGSSEFLSIGDDASINAAAINARTFYIVFQTGADITTQQYLYQQGNGTDGIFAYISAGVLTFGINSSSANHTIASATLSINTEYIVGFTYNGGSGTLDLTTNGISSTQITSVATSIVGASITITIGSDAANANFLSGHISELIYYDIVLNDGEQRVLENYLSEKYGITVVNDHYSTPNANYRYNLIGISRVNALEHNQSTGQGGTVYLSENTGDPMSDDEHIFLGHNNNNLNTTSTDLAGISDTERSNRIWYIEKTGTLGAVIEFDIVESGLATTAPALATGYSLLRRTGISGDFTQLTPATTPAINGDRVRFTLTSGELTSGYFTLGSPSSSKKWYVINSGSWADSNTWTLDPAASIYNNPDGLTPDSSPTASTDEVTIGIGKTVTLANNDLSGTLTKLTVKGIIDFQTSTGHGTVTELVGNGRIRLSTAVLPTFTDAINFTSAGSGAGTIEYYGTTDVTLSGTSALSTFYNLILNFSPVSQRLIITTDITINGNLTITAGNLQINDNSAPTKITIDLVGNLDVSINGKISVGTGSIGIPTGALDFHDTFHRFNISGNFTNNGIVNFSNQSAYIFNAFPANGDAVTVSFTGQSDNTLTCNNTTNFYDFMIDKGNDQTYILTVNSSAIKNFRVLGRNGGIGTDVTVDNPAVGKPIWIKNGTLRLTGTIFIPSLSEGANSVAGNGSWVIPKNGALWIDGPNVTVWATAESNGIIESIDTDIPPGSTMGVEPGTGLQQSLYLSGQFKLSSGIYHCRNGFATFYSSRGSASFYIEGGSMDINQLRRGAGTGVNPSPVYNQSGGIVTVNGESQAIGGSSSNRRAGIFDFAASNGVFIMSGGNLIFKDYNNNAISATTNGLNINVPESNYSVTGGTIEIDIDNLSSDGFEISFTPNFYNLSITDTDNDFVTFETDLTVSNDLILSSGTVTKLNGNNLTVGRNFNIMAGSTYTQGGNNTTSFNGSASQTIRIAGTQTTKFYDATFSGAGIKTINTGDLTVTNSMAIASGATVDDGGQTIIINNSLTNSGTHQSTGIGVLKFSGKSGSAPYAVGGDDSGVFGNVTLDDAGNDVSLSADQTITGTLTFSKDQLLDINTSKLRMQGAAAGISGASSARYIQTSGNASDGGLEMYLDANETLTFPIGTDANADVRYTPLVAVMSGFSDDGYISVNPADDILATTAGTGGSVLTYYWHVEHTDFSVLPLVTSYTFSGSESDDGRGNTSTFPNSWRAGKVISEFPFTRTAEDNTSINNPTGHDINFDGDGTPFTLENANYSAGQSNRFNGTPAIYYSRRSGRFDVDATWSKNDVTGSGTQEVPVTGSVVVIQSDGAGIGHKVEVRLAINVLAMVTFDHDYTTFPVPNIMNVPELKFGSAAHSYVVGVVSGTGLISFVATQVPVVTGDFGDFGTNTDSYYSYRISGFTGQSTLDNIPEPIPNLIVDLYTHTIDQAITINGSLIMTKNATVIPLEDIEIMNDMTIGSQDGGTFQFPGSGSAVTITVNGDIDFTTIDPTNNLGTRTLIVGDGGMNPMDLEHTLILKGNIIHGAENTHSILLFNSVNQQISNVNNVDETRPRVILELQGTSDNNYARTSTSVPKFYKLVLNKGTSQTNSFTFNDSFILGSPQSVTSKALELQNGTLILNDAAIDINLSTGGDNFSIPSTSSLQISLGQANVSGTDTGIMLDGALTIDGNGILEMDGGDNNYIEYSSSGSATLTVGGSATLSVGSQIRRNDIAGSGVLSYTQSGTSTVTVGNGTATSPAVNRSMFEVLGTGSSFNFSGGTLVVAQDYSATATPTLYLDPGGTSTISSDALVQFGNANTPTSGNKDMTIYSTVALGDLEINTENSPTLTLHSVGLTINNDLLIEAGANLNANGLNLTIAGNFNNTDGVTGFTPSANTTIFNGFTAQTIIGNGTTFYNLTKNNTNTLNLAIGTNITAFNDLRIEQGTFDDNNNNISVAGVLHNAAIHTNSNVTKTNSGIILTGTNTQSMTGEGTYSRIQINNTAGVVTSDDVIITEQVILNGGILDIQGNQLTMNQHSIFVDSTRRGFSSTNMIQTRISFSDAGIVKVFNGTAASPFTYPIGSGHKYTPVVITLIQNGQTTPTIAVRAADESHPNVQEDVDVPEFVDINNVLQYYWDITSVGMTDFIGNITFTYEGSDAYVTSPFTLNDYYTARLLPDLSNNWNKLSTGFNYQSRNGSNTVSFDFRASVADDQIGGSYTAGIENAIPDQVQTVTSIVAPSGNWSAGGSWDTGNVPRGAIVNIQLGDSITMDQNNLLAYRTEINGELIVDGTSNQRLGIVSGSGTLTLVGNGNLPAGIYDSFFNCANGGTLAFNDTNNYTLPDQITNLRNLLLAGGGIKSFPNTDVTICNNLELQDGVTLDNPQNITVSILGNLTLTNGIFNLGSNANISVNGDVTITAGSLNLGNNTLTVNGSLTINGGALVLGTNGSITVAGNTTIGGGTLTGASTSSFNIGGNLIYTSGTVSINATTTTITLNGTGSQGITGGFTGMSAFNNLTINKASGAVTIVDSGNNDVEIDGTLTLTSGVVTTNATNTMTITSTGMIAGGSTSSYINGPLTKNAIAANANFTFPIGAGGQYAYAKLIGVTTGFQNWTAQYSGSNANSSQPINTVINSGFGSMTTITSTSSWSISPSGTNLANIELGVLSGMGVLVINDIRVAIYNGPSASEWVNLGGSSSGTISDGSVTTQTQSDFSSSTFSLGGILAASLPVELLEFKGSMIEKDAVLEWVTASEINNDYFIIEKSVDGVNYEFVGEIAGSGNSNSQLDYQLTDENPYFGISYYRLVQVDYDGITTKYPAISVNNDSFKSGIEAVLFPNPTNSYNINMRFVSGDENSPVHILIYDLMGHLVHTQQFTPQIGISEYSIRTHHELDISVYQVVIKQANNKSMRRLFIK